MIDDELQDAEGPSHSRHSTLRERIVEHVFVGEALRRLWQWRVTDVEVLRSEFDAGGYDLVMSYGKIVRHIQFKTTTTDGKARSITLNRTLAEKPSGCVLWLVVTRDELLMQSYLWFGGPPGDPLPSIDDFKVARHTKANLEGVKVERPDHRIVPLREFKKLSSLDDVLLCLFGPFDAGRVQPGLTPVRRGRDFHDA